MRYIQNLITIIPGSSPGMSITFSSPGALATILTCRDTPPQPTWLETVVFAPRFQGLRGAFATGPLLCTRGDRMGMTPVHPAL